ncbi:MAG: hypothetical protein JOY59_08970 [Candidatus Eremiobacteraeota bacterium]|nr:hypothetical protein [Candidatus Eremiobacteraeota bacterium]
MLSPQTRTIDGGDADACALARSQAALLVAVAQRDRPDAFNAERLRSARACGATSFDDATAVATQPSSTR